MQRKLHISDNAKVLMIFKGLLVQFDHEIIFCHNLSNPKKCLGLKKNHSISKQRFVSSIGNIEKAIWANRAVLGSTETAEQKLKYATFEDGFFNFSGAKKRFQFFFKDILASALKSYIAQR